MFTTLFAQTWQPVGNGLAMNSTVGSMVYSTTDGQDIFVAFYTDMNAPAHSVVIQKWNGLNWSTLPSLPKAVLVRDIQVLNSKLYVAGHAWQANGTGVFEFDGQFWHELTPASFSGSATYLSTYQGDLLLGGSFQSSLSNVLLRYNGSSFDSLGHWSLPDSVAGGVSSTTKVGTTLYASRPMPANDTALAIRRMHPVTGVWETAAHFRQGTSTSNHFELFEFQNNLYAAETGGSRNLYRVANDTLKEIDQLPGMLAGHVEFGGYMYLAFVGTASVPLYRFDGSILVPVVGPSLNSGVELYQNQLYLFSPGSDSLNGIEYNYAFRTNGIYSLFSGQTFLDLNSDCFLNTGEPNISDILISLGGVTATSSINGQYSVAVPAGTYSYDTIYSARAVGKNLEVNCNLPSNITVGSGQLITQNIPVENQIPIDAQLFISGMSGWRARHGFIERYQLDFNNTGNQTLPSGSVQLTIPASLSLVSSTPSPSSSSGNVLTYDFLNVQPSESRVVNLKLSIDTNQNSIGDSLQFVAAISGVNGDADLTDNSDTVNQTITAAVDPNDKQASASRILPGTEKVDYHIRFQNTGSDTAVKVTVVDTLDMSLPITRIVINSASHPYNLSVQNNILVWEFEDLMLPDSASDPLGSQGFVRFSAGLNPSLAVGDTIDNDAEIYFDYQPAVHTNHAKTAIVQWVGVDEQEIAQKPLAVFPNPARNFLNIENQHTDSIDINILNISGQPIDQLSVKSGELLRYPLAELPAGIYLLQSEFGALRVIITE